MRNILLILVFFVICDSYLFAQSIADEDPDWRADSAAIHQKIDFVFMNLDKTKLTTGFLFERITMPLSRMQNYSGHTDSITKANHWHQMYFELKHFAEFTPSALPSSHDLVKRSEDSNVDNIIPLGIINMNINRIKTIALDSGLLYTQGEQLYETQGNTQSPYEVKRVFAISPLNDDPLRSTTTFLIDTSFYFSNSTFPILHFEIDFGDGAGFRTVNFGEQISVNYSGLDSVIINSKAFFISDTLQSKSLAFVVNNIFVQNKSGGSGVHDCSDFKIPMSSPDVGDATNDYFNPDAVKTVHVYDDFQTETGVVFLPPQPTPILAGRAYIKYGCQNTTGKLIKPFIFVDGIDFGTNSPANKGGDEDYGLRYGDRGWKQFLMGLGWDEEGNKTEVPDDNITKVSTLMKKLCSEGYDMVMLDPKDGADDIRFNAFALIDLINQINTELKQNNSKNQIVVCGASMGGQQSRYALRNMERRGIDHNTRLFISLDSPNRGANIPLGTQYAMRFGTFYAFTENKVGALFRPAAQQLLQYHYIPSKIPTKQALPYQKHIDFYNDPNMIDFPQKPRLVAITNGSGFGKEQGTDGVSYKPGDLTLHIYTGRWFIARAIGDKYNGPNEVTVFWGSYVQLSTFTEKVVEWLTNWLGEWFSNIVTWVVKTVEVLLTDVVEMKNTLPLDNTSGGWRNTNEFFAQNLLFNAHAEFGRYNHSFIPTYSAMGIHLNQIPNEDITVPMSTILNTSTYPVYNSAKSPFHAIYAPMSPDANYEHITVNDENIGWILDEVSPPDLFLQNKSIVSNEPPMIGYGYEARNNITVGYNVTNTQQSGSFIAENGSSVDIRAGNEIHLVGGPGNNGVWLKKGSNVHLFIQKFQCDAVCRQGNPDSDNNDGGRATSSIENWTDFVYDEAKKNENSPSLMERTGARLSNNYPNPFTDHTHIDYTVSDSGSVNISVYDISGQKIATLVNTNNHSAGKYTATLDARKLTPGIYFCRMETENFSETKKMALLK